MESRRFSVITTTDRGKNISGIVVQTNLHFIVEDLCLTSLTFSVLQLKNIFMFLSHCGRDEEKKREIGRQRGRRGRGGGRDGDNIGSPD